MILDYLLLSCKSIKKRKIRSWLTIIGIFIGIAAVVSLISLGQGLQNAINEQFEQLGSDKIIIQPKLLGPPGSATSESLILKNKDLKAVENVRGVKWAIGILVKQGQAKFKNEAGTGFDVGINPKDLELLGEIQAYKIKEGRDLKKGDKYKVIVGYNHAYGDIWKRGVGIRDTIEIEGVDFKIVGIIDKVGNPFDDASIYMPKETLKEVLNVKDEESEIVAKVDVGFDPVNVADNIKNELRRSRGEKKDQETFNVQTSEQLMQTFTNIFGIVQAVLIGIAAISLLVGGVGIMNTMYTAVLERTKDIGIMKAIGAKNSDILIIFLIESGLLGLIGGLIGVGLGIGMAKSGEYIATVALGTNLLKASLSPIIIFGALAFSFVIGSLSGVLPALQASRLKPVDALRYE